MKRTLRYILLFLPLFTQAQSLSIEQLWASFPTSSTQRQAQLRQHIQQVERTFDKLDKLPVVYGDLNLQRNLIIPTTPVPAIAFDPSAPAGTYIPLRFATRWSSKAGIQLEWTLFDPARRGRKDETNLAAEKVEINEKQAKQSWERDATLAYAAIVLATKQYAMALQDSTAYAEILQISRDRWQAGRESEINYLDAQQEMERKKIQRAEAWTVLAAANIELQKYAEIDTILTLSSDIPDIMSYLDSYHGHDYAVDMAALEVKIARLQTEQTKRQILPTLSFNSYLGAQYFDNDLRLLHMDSWYGNSYANLSLRIPLSAYVLQRSALQQASWRQQLREEEWQERAGHDQVATQKREQQKKAAIKKMESLKAIEDLALQKKEVLWAAYEAGRSLLVNYNAANSAYIAAQQAHWQAQYDWIDLLLQTAAD
ncbi:TolC family protein [Sphingobacterium bambusae]|uniref:TolC family protein n=1 Tax=Sphingobacterium bambusae TaxID=662858 RepID=A0ABW6BLH4_9SPHI|nr:TolC family protein [Sphingobacterium bambusae]WPL49886.1 TolC family protein [Sphingobacterium bambusae]